MTCSIDSIIFEMLMNFSYKLVVPNMKHQLRRTTYPITYSHKVFMWVKKLLPQKAVGGYRLFFNIKIEKKAVATCAVVNKRVDMWSLCLLSFQKCEFFVPRRHEILRWLAWKKPNWINKKKIQSFLEAHFRLC